MQFRLTNSQWYLVVGLVGLVGLVPGLALTKYRCEFVNLNCILILNITMSINIKAELIYLVYFHTSLNLLRTCFFP